MGLEPGHLAPEPTFLEHCSSPSAREAQATSPEWEPRVLQASWPPQVPTLPGGPEALIPTPGVLLSKGPESAHRGHLHKNDSVTEP